MTHSFISHTTRTLIDLRGDTLKGIKNPANYGKTGAMEDTVRQISEELSKRGIKDLR